MQRWDWGFTGEKRWIFVGFSAKIGDFNGENRDFNGDFLSHSHQLDGKWSDLPHAKGD